MRSLKFIYRSILITKLQRTIMTLVILALCLAMPALIATNETCDNVMGKEVVHCDNAIRTVAELADVVDSTTSVVVVKNNGELEIPARSHDRRIFARMTSYQISNVGRLKIDGGGFFGLAALLNLKLADNNVGRLIDGTFAGLSNLTRLEITNCKIETIDGRAFDGLRSLETLDLSNNRVKIITRNMFKDLTNLISLTLARNEIDSLESDCFSSLRSLRDLDLSFNRLRRVNLDVFNKIPSLGYLYLSFNKIDGFEGDFECKELKFLYLRDNRIKEITRNLFRSSKKLMNVDLAFNEISRIDDEAFNDLPVLMNLHLRNCSANVENLKFVNVPLIVV